MAQRYSEKFDPTKNQNLPCVELEHIDQENGRLLGTVDSKDQKSIKQVFSKGDVLFGKLRPNLKKYLKAPFDGVCSSEIWVLRGSKNIENDFLYFLVNTDKFFLNATKTSGTKMPRAEWNSLEKVVFSYPSRPEQLKIAEFLSALDDLITLHQRE